MKTKKLYYSPIVQLQIFSVNENMMQVLGPSGPKTTNDPFDGE